uniref:CBS domain-containing protein n=1 Tax=Sexangularia sp. CB-2014 TaxID=1486929 RepID=A0A7S1YLZ8_9EUKA
MLRVRERDTGEEGSTSVREAMDAAAAGVVTPSSRCLDVARTLLFCRAVALDDDGQVATRDFPALGPTEQTREVRCLTQRWFLAALAARSRSDPSASLLSTTPTTLGQARLGRRRVSVIASTATLADALRQMARERSVSLAIVSHASAHDPFLGAVSSVTASTIYATKTPSEIDKLLDTPLATCVALGLCPATSLSPPDDASRHTDLPLSLVLDTAAESPDTYVYLLDSDGWPISVISGTDLLGVMLGVEASVTSAHGRQGQARAAARTSFIARPPSPSLPITLSHSEASLLLATKQTIGVCVELPRGREIEDVVSLEPEDFVRTGHATAGLDFPPKVVTLRHVLDLLARRHTAAVTAAAGGRGARRQAGATDATGRQRPDRPPRLHYVASSELGAALGGTGLFGSEPPSLDTPAANLGEWLTVRATPPESPLVRLPRGGGARRGLARASRAAVWAAREAGCAYRLADLPPGTV